MKNAYNTSAYGSFAYVYDIFMDNVEYEKWAEYLIGRLREYGIEDGIVLELGCGTGVMTELLAESGALCHAALADPCLATNPREVSLTDLHGLLEAAL